MNIIETNTENMKSDTGMISGYIANLRNAQSALEGILEKLSVSWEGDAAAQYGAVFRHELERLLELIEMVSEMNRGTESAKNKYEQCEAQVADIISAIKV